MSVRHEHLHVDISPRALQYIAETLARDFVPFDMNDPFVIEVHNFINECRARVQHAAAGMPDRSDESEFEAHEAPEEDWLDT